MPTRIFMAGATGVVGRRAIPLLIDAGHTVTAVSRSLDNVDRLRQLGAEPVLVDLFDLSAVQRVMAGHDVVINLATSIPPSSRAVLPGAWRANDRVRRVVSRTLVDAALGAGAERFIQESFAPIYRDAGDRWIDESAPVEPARYNRSVLDAEAAAERFTKGRRAGVVLRFAFFYGPDSDFTRDMIRYVRKGFAPAFGSPAAFHSSVSHDDAARSVVAAMGVSPGIYNVVDDEPVRRQEFYDSLAAALGVARPKFPPRWVGRLFGSLGETLARSQRISNRKLKSESGWSPSAPSIREGWPLVVKQIEAMK
jgi:nucleoside-diphosphate-sugar epimerase